MIKNILPRSTSLPLASMRLTGRLLTICLAFWFTKEEAGDRFTTPSASSLTEDAELEVADWPALVVGGAAIAHATAMAKIFQKLTICKHIIS
jgi:hypothetical protein